MPQAVETERRVDKVAGEARDGAGGVGAGATLTRNLAALRQKQPEVAALIERVEPVSLEWVPTPEGLSAVYGGRALASKLRPAGEGTLVARGLDAERHSCAAVLGFGLGYHVRAIVARQAPGDGCLVFEPDAGLLRAVLERIDHSELLAGKGVFVIVDAGDEGELAGASMSLTRAMAGGLQVIEHAPSVTRLAPVRRTIGEKLNATTGAVKLNVVSELTQTEATFRNILFNLDHYATCRPMAALAGAMAGRLAVTVAAGPSLARNIGELARPGVRERCVVIAAQTVLKPLLARGIRPHFVTALDHHEVSARFYEGLSPEQLEGVTLVCEAKVNPAVTAAFGGRVVMPADFILDRLLRGPDGPWREMGQLTAGTTVAHLSYYLARALGCERVALIGQDLGFTDGQYYAGGAAIHSVWAGELGEFNTLEMLEWQRIKRMGASLRHATDHLGRPVYTDEQMHSYLQHFLRDFAADGAKGLTTIDATEGGVRKGGTIAQTLATTLDEALGGGAGSGNKLETTDQIIDRCLGERADEMRGSRERSLGRVRERLCALIEGLVRIEALAGKARAMLLVAKNRLGDAGLVQRTMRALDEMGAEVVTLDPAWTLVNVFNIGAAFRRWKADRVLTLATGRPDDEVLAKRLERDLTNVTLLTEASVRLATLARGSLAMLDGGPRQTRDLPASEARLDAGAGGASGTNALGEDGPGGVRVTRSAVRAVAVASVPLGEGHRGWLGRPHDEAPGLLVQGRAAVRLAVGRLLSVPAQNGGLDEVALVTDRPDQLRALLGPLASDRRVHVMHAGDDADLTPALPARTLAGARLFSRSAWRGGLANLTCYDEVMSAGETARALGVLGGSAALIFGPSWALIDPGITGAIIARHREDPDAYRLVFSQAVPGLAPCLLARASVEQLASLRASAGVLATVGGLCGYIPSAPRPDDLGRTPCVAVAPLARDGLHRCVVDGPLSAAWLSAALDGAGLDGASATATEICAAVEARSAATGLPGPWHVRLAVPGFSTLQRAGLSHDKLVGRARDVLVSALAKADALAVTIEVHADAPPVVGAIIDAARSREIAGRRVAALHVRAPLTLGAGAGVGPDAPEPAALHDLVGSLAQIDVLSLDVPSMHAPTLTALGLAGPGQGEALHGQMSRAWREIIEATRPVEGVTGLRTPWVVPRITRRDEVYSEIDGFYDHWLTAQGACVIDPLALAAVGPDARIAPLPVPELARVREAREAVRIELAQATDAAPPAGARA